MTYNSEEITMQSVDVDIPDFPFEPDGKGRGRATPKKNEWIEGTGKGKDLKFEPIDDRPSGTDDTDEEGYLYSFRGDSPPKPVINFDLKQYFPREARRANIQSKTVIVRIQVDENGTLNNATIISGRAGYGFEDAAIAIVKRARFKPGYIKGRPVRMVHKLPIQFVLE